MIYRPSTNALKLLRQLEGEKLTPYKDIAGLWTIGVGHLIKEGEEYLLNGIDEAKSSDLLAHDIAAVSLMLDKALTVPLNQNEIDALHILGFNIGTGALKKSDLLKLINAKASKEDIFKQWTTHYTTAGGKYSNGLAKRREFEAKLYQQPIVSNFNGGTYLTIAVFIALLYAMNK